VLKIFVDLFKTGPQKPSEYFETSLPLMKNEDE